MNKTYKLEYLPTFYDDLEKVVDYIAIRLENPQAAATLIDEVESAIQQRIFDPEGYEPYDLVRKHKYSYYRIYVKNYTIFYVLIDNVMEVRRFIYSRRDLTRFIR